MKKLLYIIFIVLFLAGAANADTYFVDINLSTNGVYNGTSCSGDYSIANRECSGSDGDAYESVEDLHAGEVVAAGDTVNIRAGTYDDAAGSDEEHYILPEASGTSWSNMITYQAYNGETVNITGRGGYSGSGHRGKVVSNGYDYIKVAGINFYGYHNNSICLQIENGDYWVVQNINCLATGASADSDLGSRLIFLETVTHVYFIGDDTDGKHDNDSTVTEYNDGLWTTGTNSNIIFYKWFLGKGTHDSAYMSGTSELVVWDSKINNEYHTGMSLWNKANILVHDTDIYYQGSITNLSPTADTDGLHAGLYLSGISDSIIRQNRFWGNGQSFYTRMDYNDIENTWIYNNTMYDADAKAPAQSAHFYSEGHIYINSDATYRFQNNMILNNIASKAINDGLVRFNYTNTGVLSPSGNIVNYNNWYDSDGDQFGWEDAGGNDNLRDLATMISEESEWLSENINTNPLMTNPDSQDFTLTGSSPAIDAGTHLTEIAAADSGTGTTVVLDDTRAFFDPSSWGFNEADLATLGIGGDGLIEADYIKIGTGSATQIASITNNTTLVLSSDPGARSENDPVYFCPAGQCFKGDAPDIGALEFDLAISGASPVDNATDQDVNVNLSWTSNPTGATTIDIRFSCSTSDPPVVAANQATSVLFYEPGELDVDDECWWAVDIDHIGGTELGAIRSFETASGPPVAPGPVDGGVFNPTDGKYLRFSTGGIPIVF